MTGTAQEHLMEVTGPSAESLEILARALHVKDAGVTILLATFAALALAEAQRADQMHDALANRDVIGQAKGILMERHGVAADAAFGVLSRVSQAENIKLAEIARRFVETGELPCVSSPQAAGGMP